MFNHLYWQYAAASRKGITRRWPVDEQRQEALMGETGENLGQMRERKEEWKEKWDAERTGERMSILHILPGKVSNLQKTWNNKWTLISYIYWQVLTFYHICSTLIYFGYNFSICYSIWKSLIYILKLLCRGFSMHLLIGSLLQTWVSDVLVNISFSYIGLKSNLKY